jgi:uncharacterized protein YcbX
MSLTVAALWRYPVKSLSGEPITAAELTKHGIPGDRTVHVRGPEGIRTARRHHRLLGLRATLNGDGQPLIDGLAWNSAGALELVRDAAGEDAWLEAGTGPERFDVLPLLVATDGAVMEFGRDARRLRPNILIGGVDGMAEVHWPGSQLRIGESVIQLDSLRQRCPMTMVDPDTLERDRAVLLDINHRFGGKLALNAAIHTPGTIRVGDPVHLIVPSRTEPR